jgi:hypothetical protein
MSLIVDMLINSTQDWEGQTQRGFFVMNRNLNSINALRLTQLVALGNHHCAFSLFSVPGNRPGARCSSDRQSRVSFAWCSAHKYMKEFLAGSLSLFRHLLPNVRNPRINRRRPIKVQAYTKYMCPSSGLGGLSFASTSNWR